MNDTHRATARQIAQRHLESGDPLGWFEDLYSLAGGDASAIPWADLAPNPNLVSWLAARQVAGAGCAALTVGCGLGDDAEELARRGFETTAFDISESAIAWARDLHSESPVSYVATDLLQAPSEWLGKFDLVLESYTLQVLPPDLRREAMRHVASFVSSQGLLLVIARGREPNDPEGAMPWPLTREELTLFQSLGLKEVGFEDYMDDESPPVRRFRVTYRREEQRQAQPPTCRRRGKGGEEWG